ncbi:hypothetical protein WJX75_010046 [Coccomyxa subellipsoidea]|uniref:Uncharacterized protein n=1 Tax=Coccomyxa subellipsoidea TaxID=248742 RepID=A0ABR2YQS2_9CHLO
MYIRGPGRTFSDNRVSLALKVGPEEPDIGKPQPGKESTTSKKQCWQAPLPERAPDTWKPLEADLTSPSKSSLLSSFSHIHLQPPRAPSTARMRSLSMMIALALVMAAVVPDAAAEGHERKLAQIPDLGNLANLGGSGGSLPDISSIAGGSGGSDLINTVTSLAGNLGGSGGLGNLGSIAGGSGGLGNIANLAGGRKMLASE